MGISQQSLPCHPFNRLFSKSTEKTLKFFMLFSVPVLDKHTWKAKRSVAWVAARGHAVKLAAKQLVWLQLTILACVPHAFLRLSSVLLDMSPSFLQAAYMCVYYVYSQSRFSLSCRELQWLWHMLQHVTNMLHVTCTPYTLKRYV